MHIVIIALLAATAKFILICRFMPIRQVVYFDKYVDLFFTLILPLVFWGTFSGMVTAVLSGLILSVYLFIAKLAFGSEAPRWMRRRA